MVNFHGTKRVYKTKKGVSLLIAVMLIGVISYVATMMANSNTAQIRDAANSNRYEEAFSLAEGAMEMGLLENAEHGAGYSGSFQNNYGDGKTAAYKIQGQVPVNAKYASPSGYTGMYGAPTPGTGNVGKDCDPLKAFKSDSFWYSASVNPNYVAGSTPNGNNYAGPFDAADHPCNWNKIKIGDSVSIPLYYSTSDSSLGCPADPAYPGSYVCNLATSQSDTFILRVRTPCESGYGKDEMCMAMNRYDFFTNNVDPTYGQNEPIMSWQITGVDQSTNTSMVMGPWISVQTIPLKMLKAPSTIIHEFKLNGTQQTFEVLNQSSQGEETGTKCLGPMLTYLLPNAANACADGSNWSSTAIQKPVLKLSVIQSMQSTPAQEKIPYLEYQFLSEFNTGIPPADTSQTITSEGFSGEFKATIEAKKPQGGGLVEYVLQQ